MANIAQISSLSNAGQGILSYVLNLYPIFRFAQFRPDTSSYVNYADRPTITGSAVRAEGAPAQRDNQTPTPTARNLALYSREITIDDVRKRDQNITGSPAGLIYLMRNRQLAQAVALAAEVEIDMISGADSAYHMLGLTEFVKDAASGGQTTHLGFTTAEQAAINVQANLKIDNNDDQNAFLEILDRALYVVPGANAIICNDGMKARLSTMARNRALFGMTIDQFGVEAETYKGIPLVRVTSEALTQTQSDGVNTDCTSVFVVRFAEQLGVAYSTNSGFDFMDFPEIEADPQGMSRLQFFLNLTVERTNALRRISRIRL